jgi:hypothetical protein
MSTSCSSSTTRGRWPRSSSASLENFEAFINVLEAEDVRRELPHRHHHDRRRQPALPQHHAGERQPGAVELPQPRRRPAVHVSSDIDYSEACTANCDLRDEDLTIIPTATELDPKKSPRKWIERSTACRT